MSTLATRPDASSGCPNSDLLADDIAAMRSYVSGEDFPCIGARSAFNTDRVAFGRYGRLGANQQIGSLGSDLARFSATYPDPGKDPVTFVAMFDDEHLSEHDFAGRMWRHLQKLHVHDAHDFLWDARVSDDPAAADFSFSVAGRAFFVVGLHPGASRLSRRAPLPCLVFNFHEQFETLKATGKYHGMLKVVRQRDMALQGSLNPNLAQFGDASEAMQYSGEPVDADWTCPFHRIR